MNKKKKYILMVVLILDIIVLSIIAIYLFKKEPEITHEVIFNFEDNTLLNKNIEVNTKDYTYDKVLVTIDGIDKSELLKIDDSKLNLTTLGTYQIIYYIIYEEKRYEQIQTINVVDTEKPTITLEGKNITILVNEKYTEPGYNVTDNYDKDLKDKVEIKNEVDNTKPGTYKITYRVSDTSGNIDEVSREVTVKKPLTIVSTPPKEQKIVTPKVVETSYENTIKSNKFTKTNISLEGYLKNVLEENKIYLKNDNNTYEYTLNINNNNYSISINPEEIANGTYKVYINELALLNKMTPIDRLSRGKVGNKLVSFTYNGSDEVSITIDNHEYLYDILINPGHGGWDSGAVNEYITEKEMNLKVSMYEKCRYENHGLRVYMTRTNDTYGAKMGPSGLIDLHKVAYEMGYYGAVSKIVYSNHHNSIGNNYYSGYEILTAGSLTKDELNNELQIANKWNSIFNLTENHTRFYARDFDTERIYSKLNGEIYSFKDNYAVNRIPLKTSNVKSIIFEGCYMSNKDEFKWYWINNNWYKVSEAKIEVYINSLGLTYNPDNSSCL